MGLWLRLACLYAGILGGDLVAAEIDSTASIAKILIEADSSFRRRGMEVSARRSLVLYRKALRLRADDPEVGWRLAMAASFVGMRFEKEEDTKLALFAEGRDAGLRAVELAPECAPCHFWTAIGMALYGETKGAFKMLSSLKLIRNHLKATLTRDPSYAGAGAYRILGIIEWKLPGILGGSDRRAREYFEKAIETVPEEPLNYLFLARLLEDGFDDRAAALVVAGRGAATPLPASERVESREARAELRALLEKLHKLVPRAAG